MVHARRITILSIVVNAALFVIKFSAGLVANSLAVMADATNSLLDTLYSVGILWSVGESHKRADKGHPFGHGRAEPMVAFAIALLMGIAAFEFLRSAVFGLLVEQEATVLSWPVAAALITAVVAKILLSHEAQRAGERTKSPALLASAADSRNDILITLTALAGLAFSSSGAPWADEAAAIAISGFLFYQAWAVARENIAYLVGAAPSADLQLRVREIASSVPGVRGIHLVRAHYVGSFVHAEIHILVNPRITTVASHHIAMAVQRDVEQLPGVSKAFVHVEPV